ncbi:ABC-type Fe3+-siderophore transport system, permease component [Lachnospiraceae bacterium JC7]|nr:ABC-type Fe3+-siderophore transport system, permease component [Lachnospiraceae bacterium JC7]
MAAIITLMVIVAALCIGRYTISAGDVITYLISGRENDPMLKTLMWGVRIPRVIIAFITGAGLSVSGVALQAMFGNPLVSTHVLGVSYSAGFGAALGILLFSHFAYVETFSMIFGFIGMCLTYIISRKKDTNSTLMLVLSGIIVGSVFEALTSFIKYIADPEQKLPSITYWLMGSMAGSSMSDVLYALPLIGTSVLILWLFRWRLNVISLSEDEAKSLGVDLKTTRIIIVITTTVIAASVVSMCGVISFVGLAIPHLTRMLVGNDHRQLLPMSILTGATYMIIIDTSARSLTAAEIPLSILTALIGAPIFALMLRRTGGAWNA